MPCLECWIENLWSDIFGRKARATAADDEIHWIWAISPPPDCLLDGEHVVWHNLRLADVPLVVPKRAEGFFEYWDAFICRRITPSSLRNNKDCRPQLRACGAHLESCEVE